MLNDATGVDQIYIACGYTDLRRGIEGLTAIIQQNFKLDPFQNALFLFCGRRTDRIKGILWEGDGFLLLYKRLEKDNFRWPRNEEAVQKISNQQFRWLTEGLVIDPKKTVEKVTPERAL